jgi:hypothetical protein
MTEVYTFLTKAELRDIESMKAVVERICYQTLECSYFIRQYSQNKKFRKFTWHCGTDANEFISCLQGTRLLKNLISETDRLVQSYNDVFDELFQQFRDRAAGDTLVVVHRILEGMKDLETLGSFCVVIPTANAATSLKACTHIDWHSRFKYISAGACCLVIHNSWSIPWS